ncbi:hypothetical protein SAMN04488009_1453 [Maribacter sedimenticola]|uniref:Uncharacterized protein n=1 Tax=Maribacter sedimenticola TaxID=228956 RepID=A0ABY1SF78_9FLAO|nr:hypothetical protein [Maribacter sedimenticola]SNR40735.1 hypothetical protein SAMN04488009_1453 [Maribacter sedimenticola]
MLNSQKFGLELYENLGKVFYALASADGTVHIKEIDHLRSFIRSYWLHIDDVEDEYGSDAAFRIETTFDWCLEYDKKSADCLQQFNMFYKEHYNLFIPEVKRLILDTANAMAKAYAGKNKAELIVLSKIEILFTEHG